MSCYQHHHYHQHHNHHHSHDKHGDIVGINKLQEEKDYIESNRKRRKSKVGAREEEEG